MLRSDHWQIWLIKVCIILLPFLVFFPSLSNDFVALDDELLIIDNPTAKGLTMENVKRAFTTYDPELYIPLTLLTYQIEYLLFGEFKPFVVHATNLILHIVNALLVTVFVQLLMRRSTHLFPVFCGLLFAIHPLVVETVVWGAARKDLLSSFFFLVSICSYLKWRENDNLHIFSLLAFTLGLLSKVSVVLLPIVLLLTDWLFSGYIDRKMIKEKWPYFALSTIFILIALFGKRAQVTDIGIIALLPFVSVPFYLQKFLIPIKLAILYPFTDGVELLNVRVLLGVLLMGGITVWAWMQRKKNRLWMFVWLLFLLLLLPSFANVLKGSDSGSFDIYFASDRYAYLAIIALLILVGVAIERWRYLFFVMLPILPFFMWLTYQQSLVWQTSEKLFQNVIDNYGNSHLAYNNLAGFRAKEKRLSEAEDLYRKSLAVKENPRALFNLGRVLVVREKFGDAIPFFERYIELQPRDGHGYSQLGALVLIQGDMRRATELLERGLELDFGIPELHYNLGVDYERLGRASDARASYENALTVHPGYALALKKLGRK